MPALAGLREGAIAYEKRDWKTAVAELTPVADNSPEAASLLGAYYDSFDNDRAIKWSVVAAKLGDPEMQYDMGVRIDDIAWRSSRYLSDPKDNPYFRSAAECFQLAADRGYAPAQDTLGMMYENGLKLPVNIKKSLALYRAAARQGYAPGLVSIAGMYMVGRGVKQDLSIAYALYLTALRYANGVYSVEEYARLDIARIMPRLRKRDIERAKSIAAAWVPGQPLTGLR